MTDINGKINYLRGLADGANLDTETDQGKMIAAIIDVLSDIAVEIQTSKFRMDEVEDSLNELEDIFFEEDIDLEVKCEECDKITAFTLEDFMGEDPIIKCSHCETELEIPDLEDCDCDDCACDIEVEEE